MKNVFSSLWVAITLGSFMGLANASRVMSSQSVENSEFEIVASEI
jgi:hypothetical protein